MSDLKVLFFSDSIWVKDEQHIFHQNLEKCSHDHSLLDIWMMLKSCQTKISHLQIMCVRIIQSSTKENLKKNPQEESKLKFNDELQQLNIGHISYLSKSHIQTIISAEGWI